MPHAIDLYLKRICACVVEMLVLNLNIFESAVACLYFIFSETI